MKMVERLGGSPALAIRVPRVNNLRQGTPLMKSLLMIVALILGIGGMMAAAENAMAQCDMRDPSCGP
ncbi:MAG: hypothetical protein K8T91_16745 [Planctomycetes bacterium]|nr:hypothetical protein [Planctomycetota bacterium]